jgi:repressor LexA
VARSKYTEVELGMIKDISINLKRILHLKGTSQTELSDKTGLSTSTISDYYLGKTLMSPGNLQKISDALNVPKSDINSTLKKAQTFKSIPLISIICAGEGLTAEQNIEDYIHYPFQGDYQPDYALRVKGDSMVGAGIESGDIVYMRYAQWADNNGQIVAVLINGNEEGTLKRIKWSEGSPNIKLVPENKSHKTIEVLPNQVQVCGVYMGHFRPVSQVNNN